MTFAPIRRLLRGAAQRAGITRDLAITAALRACQGELVNIFGMEYSKFAEPTAIQRDGTLVITCRSPAAAQTIRLHDSEVLRHVRAAADTITITRLFLVPRSSGDARAMTASPPL